MINFRCIGAHRSSANPEVPVQMCWCFLSFRRTWSFEPVIDRTRTVRAEVCVFNFTNCSLFNPFNTYPVTYACRNLRAKLRNYTGPDRCLSKRAYLSYIVTHRFLTINMFSLSNGLIGDGEVI